MAIHPSNSPNFRNIESPDQRIYVEHHVRIEADQAPANVHPARRIVIGTTKLESTSDVVHPQITIYAACGPFGLTFIPTAEELEALGEEMIRQATQMRDDASAQADALIARVSNKRPDQ